jgi:hypothetical protein
MGENRRTWQGLQLRFRFHRLVQEKLHDMSKVAQLVQCIPNTGGGVEVAATQELWQKK